MNITRLILAIVAVFIGIFVMDFVIHGILLQADYASTKDHWRPESEMQAYFPFLMLGQLVAAATFVLVWAMGFAGKVGWKGAVIFGLLMALFGQAGTIIGYAVQPMSGILAIKWIASAVVEGIAMGLLVSFIYKVPRTAHSV